MFCIDLHNNCRCYPPLGGYIGLFLGYALLQTPDLCFKLIEWIRKAIIKNFKNTDEDEKNIAISKPRETVAGANYNDSVPPKFDYTPNI